MFTLTEKRSVVARLKRGTDEHEFVIHVTALNANDQRKLQALSLKQTSLAKRVFSAGEKSTQKDIEEMSLLMGQVNRFIAERIVDIEGLQNEDGQGWKDWSDAKQVDALFQLGGDITTPAQEAMVTVATDEEVK